METEKNTLGEEVTTEEVVSETAETVEKEERCIHCYAVLRSGMPFCPECGKPQKKVCSKCGAELKEDQTFCIQCGQMAGAAPVEVNPAIDEFNQNIAVQKKTSPLALKLILIIVGVLAIIIATSSVFIVRQNKIKQYEKDAQTFCATVLTAAVNLEDIGNEIEDEWHDYIYDSWSIYDSIDEAVAGALYNMSDEIDTAEKQKEEIDRLYSTLKKPVGNSYEMRELCEAVKTLYDEYEEMYYCVTDPSGNYNTFKTNFGECDTEVVEAYRDLKELCEDLD